MDLAYVCDSCGDPFNTAVGCSQHMRTCGQRVEDAGTHLRKRKAVLDARAQINVEENKRKRRREDSDEEEEEEEEEGQEGASPSMRAASSYTAHVC